MHITVQNKFNILSIKLLILGLTPRRNEIGGAVIWVANGFTCRAKTERSIGLLVELTLNVQCSEIERTIFSLTNWSLTKFCLNTGNE